MREILFHGKRIDNGEWVEGFLVKSGEAHRSALRDDLPFSDCYIFPATDRDIVRDFLTKTIRLNLGAYHVIPESVSQYTGLCDKNGKKIFEGDILRFPPGTYHPVFYNADYCGFGSCYFNDFDSLYKYNFKNIEVVGNIQDNPELLEVEDG